MALAPCRIRNSSPEMLMRHIRFVTTFALAACVSAGAQGPAPSVTRALEIGCGSCAGAAQFGRIRDVSISARGEILVTDRDAPMLRRFDLSGKSVWTGGRKGRGPGEFTLPVRSAITPGGIVVIDMSNSRLTELDPEGKVDTSVNLTSMATTTSVTPRGDVLLGFDDMRRSFRVVARSPAAQELKQVASFPGSVKNKSVALSADGVIAVALDGEQYEIRRLDLAGKVLPPIARQIPRPRRSAVEEAEFRQRRSSDLAMMSAEMKRQGMDGNVKAPVIPPDERGLKAQITVDGLCYDDAGRLWVHTMQGDETKTVFDVFSPNGAFLGPVTIPMRADRFSVGGKWLITAGENEEGVPVVVVWTVK
jgi:hypothetical protein